MTWFTVVGFNTEESTYVEWVQAAHAQDAKDAAREACECGLDDDCDRWSSVTVAVFRGRHLDVG